MKLGHWAFANKRFLLNDVIYNLAYDHKDITTKFESLCEGPEIFIMSAIEAKTTVLHPSGRYVPTLRQPRSPMKSMWENRRKDAFANERKRLEVGLAPISNDPTDHVSEES